MNWWHNRLTKMRQQHQAGMSIPEITEYWRLSVVRVRTILELIRHREGEG